MEFIRAQKLLQDYYAVPDYQREYEWTNTENGVLLDDIIALLYDTTNETHFTGAIVSIPYEKSNGVNTPIDFADYQIDERNVKHIVDGQQRLTSLSVLIKALIQIIQDDQNAEDKNKERWCNVLNRMLLGDETNSKYFNAPRLVLSGNTGKCYNKAILGISDEGFNALYKGAKRLLKAKTFYLSEIIQRRNELINSGVVRNAEDFYDKIINVIKDRMIFVEILCDGSSNAFQVFDSLNGKGLDLTAADRIKNILMSWSPKAKGAAKWDELVAAVGEDNLTNFFVALFFYSSKRRVSKNKLPDEFKSVYKESATSDFNYFFSDLLRDGSIYGNIRKAVTENKSANELLLDLQQLGMEQVYVMIFAALKHYENIVNDAAFTEFLESIVKLVVRMQVCEKSTNRLDSKFSEWIEMMKNQSMSLQAINTKIVEFKLSMCDDEQFVAAFSKFSPDDNKLSEYYLRCLENEKRRQDKSRDTVKRGLTVEHIIPQGLDPAVWYEDEIVPEEIIDDFKDLVVENIGNKALLYGDDNSSANNNIYEKKKDVYMNGKRGQDQGTPVGTFKLISELLATYPNRFKYEEVKERASSLAKTAVDIW